jgi:hypothetical protein
METARFAKPEKHVVFAIGQGKLRVTATNCITVGADRAIEMDIAGRIEEHGKWHQDR